jgi:hypothetical protein
MDLTFQSVIADGNKIDAPPSSSFSNLSPSTESIVGTNPLIWNAPATNALSFDANSSLNNNPNAINAKAAAAYAANPTEANKAAINSGSKLDPNKQKTKGYEDILNNHTVTTAEISALEVQTNLSLYPYMFGGELARIKHQFSDLNIDKYYILLNFLVYGFDNKILSSSIQGNGKYVVDQGFINDFLKMAKQPGLQDAIKKTPAYAKKSFDDIGKLGTTQMNADNMSNNPITGPKRSHPSLITNLLEKVHPGAMDDIQKFCNAIRTHSYLSMPKGALGSIGRVVAGINGVISSFQAIINDIYNGLIQYVQQFYAWVNGIVSELQQLLLQAIEDIIPLDLICLLLDTFQTILDDIGFFTSLFNMSNSFTNTISQIQNVVNIGSQFLSNPFSSIQAYLPANVNNVIQQINQIGTDPGGFLADQLSNHGYAYVAQAMQGNILGALSDKFGPQYAAFNPIGNMLAQSGNILNRYGQGAQMFPSTAASMGPNIYNGGREDLYGHPINSGNIFSNIAKDFQAGVTSAKSIAGK